MLTTRTGNFPIGFRRLTFSPWQKDPDHFLPWAKKLDFGVIDLGRDANADGPNGAKDFTSAGFRIGSADLPEWSGLISPDATRRHAAVEQNAAYIRACAAQGVKNFFMVMLPEKILDGVIGCECEARIGPASARRGKPRRALVFAQRPHLSGPARLRRDELRSLRRRY